MPQPTSPERQETQVAVAKSFRIHHNPKSSVTESPKLQTHFRGLVGSARRNGGAKLVIWTFDIRFFCKSKVKLRSVGRVDSCRKSPWVNFFIQKLVHHPWQPPAGLTEISLGWMASLLLNRGVSLLVATGFQTLQTPSTSKQSPYGPERKKAKKLAAKLLLLEWFHHPTVCSMLPSPSAIWGLPDRQTSLCKDRAPEVRRILQLRLNDIAPGPKITPQCAIELASAQVFDQRISKKLWEEKKNFLTLV